MMRLALIGLIVSATTTFATDPASERVAKKVGPKTEYRPNIYLQAAVEAERREQRLLAAVIELVSSPHLQFPSFVLKARSDDLSEARKEWHRFWMNNQPSTLTYERLNGAIGP